MPRKTTRHNATDFERALAMASGKSNLMIRFYALRMIEEICLGRPLDRRETGHLTDKVLNSFPTRTLQDGRRIYDYE